MIPMTVMSEEEAATEAGAQVTLLPGVAWDMLESMLIEGVTGCEYGMALLGQAWNTSSTGPGATRRTQRARSRSRSRSRSLSRDSRVSGVLVDDNNFNEESIKVSYVIIKRALLIWNIFRLV